MMKETLLARSLPVFTLFLYLIVATIGAFHAGIWAIVAIAGVIILLLATTYLDKKIPLPQSDITAIAILALGVMAFMNYYSWQPEISWRTWLKLATIFLPLIFFSSPRIQVRVFHPILIIGLFIAVMTSALALSLELAFNGPILQAVKGTNYLTEYNRGFSYLVILAFPIMAGLMGGPFPLDLKKRWWLVIPFVLVLLIPASLTESRTAKLGLMLSFPAMLSAYLWPVFTRRALSGLLVLCLAWPFAVQSFFLSHHDKLSNWPGSWHHRIEIWDYMSYRIMEHPIMGWGLGSAYKLPLAEPNGALYEIAKGPVSHPHNALIELWVELGLPGLALGFLFALWALHKTSSLNPRSAPFAVGAWVTAVCLSFIAYDFWTDSMFSAFALAGLLFALLERNRIKV